MLLGASNLARDLPRVLAIARGLLGPAPREDVFVAAGHGRSYGTWSRVVFRGLPGIAECGLWERLERSSPGLPTRALLTDVGNDLLYGVAPERIAGWVEACLARLDTLGARTVLTLLPLESIRRLGPVRFQILRTLLYPARFHRFRDLLARTEELQGHLRDLAGERGLAAVEPEPPWYGLDRIHLRRGARERAWRRQLAPYVSRPHMSEPGRAPAPEPPLSRLAWWALTPERWKLLGWERGRPQPAGRLENGARVWLY